MNQSKLQFFTSLLLVTVFLVIQLQAIPYNDFQRVRFNPDTFKGSQGNSHVPVQTIRNRFTGRIEQRYPYGYGKPKRRFPQVSNQRNPQNPTSVHDNKDDDNPYIDEREQSQQKNKPQRYRPSSTQTWENPLTGEIEEHRPYEDGVSRRKPSQVSNQQNQEDPNPNPVTETKKENGKTYTEEWKQILQRINAQNDPFKNPPKFATFTPSQREIFIEHLNHTDILKIGEFNGKPMFADLTNGVAEIIDQGDFYDEYFMVWETRENLNKQSLEEVKERLRKSFVTIHPRYKTIFDLQNDLILQDKDTHNAIFSTHPHYEEYLRWYKKQQREWDEIRESIKDHDMISLGPISEFDKRLKLQDPLNDLDIEYVFTPKDFDYGPRMERYELQVKEEEELEGLLAKKVSIKKLGIEDGYTPDTFEVTGFSHNPILSKSRLNARVAEAYKDLERDEEKGQLSQAITENLKVTQCSEDDFHTLCVEGHPTIARVADNHDRYKFFFEIFVQSRREQREQEIIQEIPLHELGREEGKNNQGVVYFDYTLKEGPFNSTHSRYIHYEATWNLLKELNDTKDARWLADLTRHKIDVESTRDGDVYFDHDLNKKIFPRDKVLHEKYERALVDQKEIEQEESDPFIHVLNQEGEPLKLVFEEGKLPQIKNGFKTAYPGTRRWEVYRKVYLKYALDRRRDAEDDENKKLREISNNAVPER